MKIKKEIRITDKWMVSVLLLCFVIVCVIFPADYHNLKKISFSLILILGIKKIRCLLYPKYIPVLFMAVLFPLCTIIRSIILGSDCMVAFSAGYAGLLFILLIVIFEYKIDYEKILVISLRLLCYTTLIIVLMDIFHVFDVNNPNPIKLFVYTNEMGVMGKSSAYAAYYKVFFKASPLFIILLYVSFEKKKYFDIIASSLALFLSGTRGNIFAGLALFLYMTFMYETKKKSERIIKRFLMTLVIILGIILVPKMISFFSNMMQSSGSVASDAVRIGQIQGMMEVFDDPINLIKGVGYGNPLIYDYGRGMQVLDFELSFFALLRKVGLLWFVLYIVFLIYPLFTKVKGSIKVLLICYLAIASTNPLLYSSTAMLMYIYVYTKVIKTKIESKKRWVNIALMDANAETSNV